MIPGKVFFESINVSQEMSKRYEINLLLNNIYYDKIKLFQTKYLCLTANDILEVELGISQPVRQDCRQSHQGKLLKDLKNVDYTNEKEPIKQEAFVKVMIPQTYKLLVESKTVNVRFQLNKKNNYEEIGVNLAFEPVSSFNRKKLGVPLLNGKNDTKNLSNNRLAYFKNSSENQNVFHFNEEDSMNSEDQLFPEELNFKNDQYTQVQSPKSNYSKAQTIKNPNNNFFDNNPIQNKRNSRQRNQRQRTSKQGGFSKQKRDQTLGQQFSHTINSETFSDLFDKQINTTRTHNIITRQNIKISQDSNQQSQTFNQYQTEGNYQSSEVPSELDTLESLAYQREKILGQLFGKFSQRNKK